MSCPDEQTLLDFLDGRLDAPAIADVETHLGGCAACRDLVTAVAPAILEVSPPTAGRAPIGTALPLPRGAMVGRYVVLALVGRGGMGEVYAAYDPELNRKIALKVLHHEERDGDSRAPHRARLLREAQAIARLSHPNVVAVHDAGTVDGRVFLAMDFVEGETLDRWLRQATSSQRGGNRSWREIRQVFLAAGRGLEAAHAAGLVHRDFKPQNVMISPDGGVRVMDFGLASETASGPERSGAIAGTPGAEAVEESGAATAVLTEAGTLVGTPAYMAPEQFLAQPADARSDEFSFSVALWEALYGERPFRGDSLVTLSRAVTTGLLAETPPRSGVPTWLRRVLVRALEADPARRFPSMTELLAALERDPQQQRRRVSAAVAVGLLLLGGGAVAQRVLGRTGAALCRDAGAKLAGIWDLPPAGPEVRAPRREAGEAAFLASGKSFAADTWSRVARLLDIYARRWTDMYTEACQATHVRGEQSAEVLDLRMECLRTSLGALQALTDVLVAADGTVVAEAVNAASALPELAHCADVAFLRAVVPPPRDADTRLRAEQLRSRLVVARTLRTAGRYQDALSRVRPMVAEARALRYGPVLAEVQELLAWLDDDTDLESDAESTMKEALWTALESRHDELAADAAIMIYGLVVTTQARYGEAATWGQMSEALLDRLGPGHERLRAYFLQDRGGMELQLGNLEAARADYQAALAQNLKAHGPDHPQVALSLSSIGEVLAKQGQGARAVETLRQSLEILTRAYGPQNPNLARPFFHYGEVLNTVGAPTEARAAFQRVLDLWTPALGAGDKRLAYPLTGIGRALLVENRGAEARPLLERALALRENGEPDPIPVAETRFALARALWSEPADRPRARTLAAAARAAYAAVPTLEHDLRDVDGWLANHHP